MADRPRLGDLIGDPEREVWIVDGLDFTTFRFGEEIELAISWRSSLGAVLKERRFYDSRNDPRYAAECAQFQNLLTSLTPVERPILPPTKENNPLMIAAVIAMLGLKAKDRVTGFSGVVTSVGFDLYGCVQVVLSPPAGADGKIGDGHWFDVNRIEVGKVRVMATPDFGARQAPAPTPSTYQRGPAEKPAVSTRSHR